jgi:DNA-binding transcriptional LysR family regulator
MSADFESLKYFSKVAETLSFVRAANDLNIQKSLLSRRIAELENQMGVRLFQRTTRKVSLTEEGEAFLQEVREGVHIFEQAIESVQSTRSAPQGTVRISTPVEFGLYLLEYVMPGFFETYPLVKIEWDFSGENRDLLQNRLDLVIRAGNPNEESLVVNKLGAVRLGAFVSPRLKIPKMKKFDIEALEQLPWIIFHPQNSNSGRETITILRDGKEFEFSPKHIAPYRVNNLSAIKTIVKQGHGIGFLPRFIFEKEIKEESIKEFLPKIEIKQDAELFLLYPSKSFIPPKTKVLSQWILSKTKQLLEVEK